MDYYRTSSHQLESLTRLRYISIAEIVMACGNFLILFTAGKFKSTFIGERYSWSWSWALVSRLSLDFMILYTGCWGLFVARTARQGVMSRRSFMALGGLNLMLCVISAVMLVFLIINAILTGVLEDYPLSDPGHFWLGADLPNMQTDLANGTGYIPSPDHYPSVTVIVSAYFLIGLFLISLGVLTGFAARICRTNLTILTRG